MKQRGFTLIELMIVIAIIGIIAAVVAGPRGHQFGSQKAQPRQKELCLNGFKHIEQGGVAYQTLGENGGGVPCQ